MQRKIQHVIVIGAGPSGLFAARSLAKKGIAVTVLEKTAEVGGKCSTYSDKDYPQIKTERGAVLVAPNYGVVLDAIQEKKIDFEEPFPTDANSVNLLTKVNAMSLTEKIVFAAAFASELCRFTYHTACYQVIRSNSQALPPDYELPFSQFAQKYQLENINTLLKTFVTAFGYGLMETCATHAVMEYVGLTSIPALLLSSLRSGLVNVKGGYQLLMRRIAEDFNVITSAEVMQIHRDETTVMVQYAANGSIHHISADALVLAVSPQHWNKLGMNLTALEQQCVDQVSYFRYPVAVCKLQGYAAKQQFVPHALESKGLRHAALFTTRDNRKTGQRLGTTYINLPPKDHAFEFNAEEKAQLAQDLKRDFGAEAVEVLETRIWEDYMPCLPWSLRLELEKSQMQPAKGTLYVGAYAKGGFEDVACVAAQATQAVETFILQQQKTWFSSIGDEMRRMTFFYRQPRLPPETENSVMHTPMTNSGEITIIYK